MKTASFYSIPHKAIVASLVAFFAFTATASAQETVSQFIKLELGWNIVSTPKVLDSHAFSAAETSENFDIYLLDPSQPSGWATMTDVGQDTFTPLYGYFINNKTGAEQTLTFNYDTQLEPNEKLFERTFSTTGWYSIGVANNEYAKAQDENIIDTNNPSKILSLMEGKYDTVIDFTDGEFDTNPASVAVGDDWKGVVQEDINALNDLRETKGYAVYMKESGAAYTGFQSSASSTGGGSDEDEYLVNVIAEQEVEGMVVDGAYFGFDIQPTQTDIVLDILVIRVSTPGATTSEIIDGSSPRGSLIQDDGDSALYAFDYDQRIAISAGQKQRFGFTFLLDEDFVDPTITQEIQISIGPDETTLWELYSGIELIPTSEIGGEASSALYSIFSYGVIIDDLYVDGNNSRIPNTMQFEVEVDATFISDQFNVIDDFEWQINNNTYTINGLTYRLEGPAGFLATTTLDYNKHEYDEGANLEYVFTIVGSEPGQYTFIVEEVFFISDNREKIIGVFQDYLDEEEFEASANIADPADNLTGFADLQQFNLYPADFTSIPVGGREEVLAISEAVFIDGDALIKYLDVQFAEVPVGAQLWEAFDSLALWVDGDKIAEMPTKSADDFLGTDDNVIRFNNLDLVSLQGDTTSIVIVADVASTSGPEELGIYELQVSEFAYEDADSTLTIETEFDDIGAFGGVNFEIEALVEELVFSLSPSTPDAAIFVVENNQDSIPYNVFVYEVSAGDSNTDITIGSLEMDVTVGSSTYFDIVDDARLIIDGEIYDDLVVENGDTQTATLWFDINNQHVVERGTTDEIELELAFNPLEPEFEGVTVVVEANSTNVDATEAEGLDDLSLADLQGTATGETHTLRTVMPVVTDVNSEMTADDPNNSGTISFEFTIEAESGDLDLGVANKSNVNGDSDDIRFTITGPDTTIANSAVALISGDAVSTVNGWTIAEGDAATFVLDTTFTTVDSADNGIYRVNLDSIAGIEIDETSSGLSLSI